MFYSVFNELSFGTGFLGWLGTCISATGVYLVSHRDVKGQYVHLIGNAIWVFFGILTQQFFLIPLNIFYFIITVKNLSKWRL